ncbi:MAG: undecaprenyl-diphosphate phosphatase [Candidatus Saelkia tenebricola]|nr:undecaprenyl-diphosphate phosphatase [Candidatus Saelkia tenebricola]
MKPFLLAFVQGVTEFLPVSSSGHLSILEHLFHIQGNYIFTVYLHIATTGAIIFYLHSDIRKLFTDITGVIKIILAFAITVLVAVFMKKYALIAFTNLNFIGICFFITAAFLFLSDRRREMMNEISFKSALIIGFVQGLAVLPGISRSGVTVAAAILLGVKPASAFKFSFLLAIPTILGAGIYEMGSISNLLAEFEFVTSYLLSFATAFIVGVISLMIFKKLIERKKLLFFALYCCIIGAISLLIGGLKC